MFPSFVYNRPSKFLKKKRLSHKELFFETYSQIAGKMYSLCIRYAGNIDDAEEVFIRSITILYNEPVLLKSHHSLKNIRNIFVKCTIDYLSEKEQELFKNIPMYIGSKRAALKGIEKYTETELVQKIISLPARYRIVFNLHLVENYSIGEISQMLNISKISVSSLIDKSKLLFMQNPMQE